MKNIDNLISKYLPEEGETTNDIEQYARPIGDMVFTRKLKNDDKKKIKKIAKGTKLATKLKSIDESKKSVNVNELVIAFGGDKTLKSFKKFELAWSYVNKNIDKIVKSLGINKSDLPLVGLQTYIKGLFK